MDKDSHQIDIDSLLTVAGGEFYCFGLMKSKKAETMVSVTNGHCLLQINFCHMQEFKTWHINGTLSFKSPMLPQDPIKQTAVVSGALADILRTATRLAGEMAVDFGSVFKSSIFLSHFSDAYVMPEEALWSSAWFLMQQEVALSAQIMGHLYDATNEVLFGVRTRCMPQLEAALQGYLPRDQTLHARHVDAVATRNVHEQVRNMFFLIESADELLVKPKEPRTLN